MNLTILETLELLKHHITAQLPTENAVQGALATIYSHIESETSVLNEDEIDLIEQLIDHLYESQLALTVRGMLLRIEVEDFYTTKIIKMTSSESTENAAYEIFSIDTIARTGEVYTDNFQALGINIETLASSLRSSMNTTNIFDEALTIAADYNYESATANDLLQMKDTFISRVKTKIDALDQNSIPALDYLGDAVSQGPAAVLTAIKQYYTKLNTAHEEGQTVEFIDNDAYYTGDFLTGAIRTAVDSIATVVSTILFAASKVLGLIAGAISMLVSAVTRLGEQGVDELTYAQLHDQAKYREFPYGVMQFNSTYEQYIQIYSQYPEFREYGNVRIKRPGYTMYAIDASVDATYSAKIIVRLDADYPKNAWQIYSSILSYSAGSVRIDIPQYSSDIKADAACALARPWLLNMSHQEISPKSSAEDVDKQVRKRFANAYSLFIVDMLVNFTASQNLRTYTFTSSGDDWAYLVLDLLIVRSPNPDIYGAFTWNKINGDNDGNSTYLQHMLSFQNSSAFTLTRLFDNLDYFSNYCTDVQQQETVTNFTDLGRDYITPPKYSRSSVIATLVLGAISIAAITAVVTITAFKVKRAINKKRFALRQQADQLYEQYNEASSAEERSQIYNQYYKAVRKNNRFTKIFGGTQLAYSGVWDEVDSSDINDKQKDEQLSKLLTLVGSAD